MTTSNPARPVRVAHHPRQARPVRRPERGAIVPLVALSMMTVLLIVTLVVDGSQAYPTRRRAQNAADAAALAATQQLDRAKWFTTDPVAVPAAVKDIYDKALSAARSNGGPATTITCTFIDGNGNPVTTNQGGTSCTGELTPGLLVPDAAQGVRIVASVPRQNTFGKLAGSSSITARATAAATVQKLSSVGSPFIVCANPIFSDKKLMAYDILRTDALGPRPDGPDADTLPDGFIYNSDGSVDVDPAKAWTYAYDNPNRELMVLQGDNGKGPSNCNGGAENTGKGVGNTTAIPGWVDYVNGNGNEAAIAEQVLSAKPCPVPLPAAGTALDCDILLPLAIDGSKEDDEVYVVGLGQFHVIGDGRGSPKYYGYYVASGAYVAGGTTSIDPVTAASVRVVRLIE